MKKKQEASTVGGNLKGYSAPSASKIIKRKKIVNNVNKPYGEPELFEKAVIKSELDEEDIGEVVRKIGNRWIVFDDKTDAQMFSYPKRTQAWVKQRQLRAQSKIKKDKRKSSPKIDIKKEEFLKNLFKKVLKESLHLFEQPELEEKTLMWDNFLEGLPKEIFLSNPELRNILLKLQKSESDLLNKSYGEIENVIGKLGGFEVKKGKLEKNPETDELKLSFSIKLKESGKNLDFAIKIENGKSTIFWPDETKQAIKDINNRESELLEAQLKSIQSLVLDKWDDAIKIAKRRDSFLEKMENDVERKIKSFKELELRILKHLLDSKYLKK